MEVDEQLPNAPHIGSSTKWAKQPRDANDLEGVGTRGIIVSGSRDRTVRVWDGQRGLCLYTLKGHLGSVLCLDYDEETLITGSSDATVIIWDFRLCATRARATDSGIDAGSGEVWVPSKIGKLEGHGAGVLDVSFDKEWIISTSKDTTIRITSRKDMALKRVYRQHVGPVNAGCLGKLDDDRTVAVSASGDGSVQMWDPATGECLRVFEGHERGLACISFANMTVVTGSNDQTVRVWDAKTGACRAICRGHAQLVRATAFDPIRYLVAGAGYDRQVMLWDAADALAGPTCAGRIFDVRLDAQRIISAGEDKRICITDFVAGEPLMRLFQ
ncbi:WD40 repeat-like protein [Ceraceosorus guamensis]|uniref:WD40 repeat-like protein n=1 Tax=Ceraceosorus guamensis TaxID=1522189 RepID=A0A316VXD4_9BASI|nr:WD40 repeat-like protein [Ceraceosorus guamensis]PWN42307.1 WD40 repeat-like protein [Ceraceosorus guamensis]